ncbi:MAG: class I SAM-dependent methyltransferase [Betaproteobacteria bacterium]|nr:class I SAM-dependent methyltransferase [Betaproteobacteria bacterium]
MVRCMDSSCHTIRLDLAAGPGDISKPYGEYFTHDAPKGTPHGIRRIYRTLRYGFIAHQFGYTRVGERPSHRVLGWILSLLPECRAYFEASVMWLRAKPGGRVLDVGCGRGDLVAELTELGWKAQGIDTDRQALAIARDRGLEVMEGCLDAQDLAANTYDAVVMSHVIEHLEDPRRTIQECWRVLKPGGTLVLLTPNPESLGHRLFQRDWLHLDPPRHLHLFPTGALSKIVREAGFSRVQSFTHIRDARMTLGASIQLRRKGSYVFGKLPLPVKLVGSLLANLEWLAVLFSSRMGEELTVIAEK